MRGAVLLGGILLATGLAGCLGDPVGDPPSTDGTVPPLGLAGLDAACPPGGAPMGDLCVRFLTSTTESLQEPFLAVDPNRPGVMAIGVNAGHTSQAPRTTPIGGDLILLDVYVTEDAGATWRLAQIPYVPTTSDAPVTLSGSGDPALAFAKDGTLHVSGIISNSVLVRGFDIFYTSSPDLGRTWTEPVVFTDTGGEDRNWMNVGPDGTLYVPWQTPGASSSIAWSADGGATWKQTKGNARANDCITVSPVAFANGTPLIACTKLEDRMAVGIDVLSFDVSAGEFTRVGGITREHAYWPQLRTLLNGTLLLAFEDYSDPSEGTIRAALSQDGGATWSEPVDLRDRITVDDSWDDLLMMWLEPDPWGGVHFVLADAVPQGPATQTWNVAYVALDATLSHPLFEAPLPAVPPREPQDPGSLAPSWGDHYYGIGFDGDTVWTVWTASQALGLTTFTPRFAVTSEEPTV